jgi:hypothetical protein
MSNEILTTGNIRFWTIFGWILLLTAFGLGIFVAWHWSLLVMLFWVGFTNNTGNIASTAVLVKWLKR